MQKIGEVVDISFPKSRKITLIIFLPKDNPVQQHRYSSDEENKSRNKVLFFHEILSGAPLVITEFILEYFQCFNSGSWENVVLTRQWFPDRSAIPRFAKVPEYGLQDDYS